MNELLPNSIADERFKRLDRVAKARFDAIDRSRVLVMLLSEVEASALPHLGWQFGALGEDWSAATEAQRRVLLESALARRQKRGTPWAVKDAIESLGHNCVIQERPGLLHDGSARYDGTFNHAGGAWWFWVIVDGARERAALEGTVERWKRKSTRAQVFFVSDILDAEEPFAYSTEAYTSLDIFDPTFDLTFE